MGFSKFSDEDPTDLTGIEETAAYKKMSAREKLSKFDPNQKGYLSTELTFGRDRKTNPFEFWKSDDRYYSDLQRKSKTIDYYVKIPVSQVGYWNLNHRVRERNPLYMIRRGPKPVIRRRSPNLYNLEVLPDLLELESSFDDDYEYKAQSVLVDNYYPMFSKSIYQEGTSLDLAMFMLLLPIALEKARMTFLLDHATRNVLLSRIGNTNRFTAVFPYELSQDDIVAVTATVGCSVMFYETDKHGKKWAEKLFVTKFHGNTLILTYPTMSGFTKSDETKEGPDQGSFLYSASNFVSRAHFKIPALEFKLLETGVIDAMTSCGHLWFEDEAEPNSGKPLITDYQLDKLRRGEGFYDSRLTDSQKDTVCTLLRSAGTIKAVMGGGGCGKTSCLDEMLMQLCFHHKEDTPASAMILLAVPTNLSAETTINRLLSKGFPPEKILHVLSEQAPLPTSGTHRRPQHKRVRVTQYLASEDIQLIIGTVQVLPRLAVPKKTKLGLFNYSPLVIAVEEVCAATAAEVLTLLISNGEPQQVVVVGDQNQLPPRYNSRLAQLFYGGVSFIHLLKRRGDFFIDGDEYPTPNEGFGACLTENHRANSELVALASTPFYGGGMTAGAGCTQHNNRTLDLKSQLNDIPYLKDLKGAYLWLDGNWQSIRNPITLSLSNRCEAVLTSRLLYQIGEIVGYSEIVVLTPYTAQVETLKACFKDVYTRNAPEVKNIPVVSIGSVDEFQGMESSIVLISLVRSTNPNAQHTPSLGFLSLPERINAMITRARHMVIVIGSQEHFAAGESNFWDFLIKKAATRKFQ